MDNKISNYKCPDCSAALKFSADMGMLLCEYCGGSFEAEYMEALGAASEEYGVENGWATADWNLSQLQAAWQEKNIKSYSCPSCGAVLVCHSNTAATSCPYCDNSAIIEEQLSDELKPDYIIPFALGRQGAVNALKSYFKDRPFLPGKFKTDAVFENIQGIYQPFWLFDGLAAGKVDYDGVKVIEKSSYEYDIIIRRHYNIRRGGHMRFEKVPVSASNRLPREYMDSIEPYDYKGLKRFSTGYLPGFMAESHNVSVDECKEQAHERCRHSLEHEFEKELAQYDELSCLSSRISVRPGQVHYALFPVWIMTVKWMGGRYVYAINGQTGKLTGKVPLSYPKIFGLFAAVCASLGGLGSLLSWLFTQLPLS